MEIADLEKDLAAGKLRPVYFIYGEEIILRDRLLGRITDVVPEGMKDFNYQNLDSEANSAGEVLAQARTMPFMGPPRLIIVKGVERYSTEDLALFQDYIDDPNEQTCLILTAEKPDFRLKFFKSLRNIPGAICLEAPKGRRLVAWVREAMHRRGPHMSDEAAQELIDRVGTELTDLDLELEKISLYALGQKRVGVPEVMAAARLGHTASVFALGDAVGEQQAGRALTAMNDLMSVQHHLPILLMLVRHFRLLLKARVLLNQGGKPPQAAKVLGVPPFAARKYLNQARGLELHEIKKGLARLLKANLTLISDPTPPRLVMDQLVLDLTSLRSARRTGF